MKTKMAVAEIKRRFSEVVGRVSYRGERFVITRREVPVAALVSLEDLKRLESGGPHRSDQAPRGLLAAIGAWEDFKNLDQVVREIYKGRAAAADRSVTLPS